MYKYDAAISYASFSEEDKEFAKKIAERLSKNDIKVFFYNWCRVELLGENLYEKLAQIYRDESLFAIPIFSKSYCERDWPLFEFEHMQERAKSKKTTYILSITLDGNIPLGYPSSRVLLDARQSSIDEIVYILTEKINQEKMNSEGDKYSSKIYEEENVDRHKMMTIVNGDGTEEEVEVVVAFELKENKNEYVVYTKGERDNLGNIMTYVSKVDREGGEPTLIGVEDESEWKKVKAVLRELAEGDDEAPVQEYMVDGIELL